jgi:UDP-N-acetylmuramate--alanine ligase
MQESYFRFAGQVHPEGTLLVHETLKNAKWGRNCLTYGIDSGDFRAENLRFGALQTEFDFVAAGLRLDKLSLPMPGYHNVSNMVAALALAQLEGASPGKMRAAVSSFAGIYRRFEVLYHSERLTYIDDYAHHPSELEAAITTARAMFPERQLIVVFQPHLYSRTRDFYQGFARALSQADRCLLMDIYPARELPIPGVDAEMIVREIKGAQAEHVGREELIAAIAARVEKPAVVMSLGAGDIDKEVHRLSEWAKESDQD